MGCLENMNYEVLAKNCSFKEARDIIQKNSTEKYEVLPGFKLLEKPLMGVPPLLVGIKGQKLVYGYTKPCHGTFVVAVEDLDSVDHVRKNGKPVR
ncbi:MAG: DUF1894 domain-containing protein [Methanocalculaceae archaeon]|jgi:hypothetical protein|nr:DUF1894 domain-containing protein [Methanocalculaceae archaeon]